MNKIILLIIFMIVTCYGVLQIPDSFYDKQLKVEIKIIEKQPDKYDKGFPYILTSDENYLCDTNIKID